VININKRSRNIMIIFTYLLAQ